MQVLEALIAIVVFLVVILTPIAAWITHVFWGIKAGAYLFLLVGGLLFPIGVIHGVGLWFGWFV